VHDVNVRSINRIKKQPESVVSVQVDFRPLLSATGELSTIEDIEDVNSVISDINSASIVANRVDARNTLVRWRIAKGTDGDLARVIVKAVTTQGTKRHATCVVDVIDDEVAPAGDDSDDVEVWDDINNVVARYDFNDLSEVLIDDGDGGETQGVLDGAIWRVVDQSGNGNHLIQNTLSKRPLIKDEGGLHAAWFDGINDVLQLTTFSGWAGTQPFTVIGVFKFDVVAAGDTIFDSAATGAVSQLKFANAGAVQIMAAPDEVQTPAGSISILSVANTHSVIFDAEDSILLVNGGSNLLPSGGDPGNNPMLGLKVGANRAESEFMAGYCKYLVVISGVVDVNQHNAIGEWLAARFSITTPFFPQPIEG